MLHLPPPCSTSLIFSVHTYKKKAVKDGRYRRSSLRLTTAAAAAQLTQTSPDWAISQSAPDAKVTLLCALHCIAFSRQILLLLLLCKKKMEIKEVRTMMMMMMMIVTLIFMCFRESA